MSSVLDHVKGLSQEELAEAYSKLNGWKWPKGWPKKPHFWDEPGPKAEANRYGYVDMVMRHILEHVPARILDNATRTGKYDHKFSPFTFYWHVWQGAIESRQLLLSYLGTLLAGLILGWLLHPSQPVPAFPEAANHDCPDTAPDQEAGIKAEVIFEAGPFFRPASLGFLDEDLSNEIKTEGGS